MTQSAIEQYCLQVSSPLSATMQALHRETQLKTLQPHMLSDGLQANLLIQISKMLQPRYVLEIGTFTGFSALCFVQGLAANGQLHTVEPNVELAYFHQKYLQALPQINVHYQQGMQAIAELNYTWDLVYIDADKQNNENYFETVLPKVRKGGWILIDNVLWKNKVLDTTQDAVTNMIHLFNKKVSKDTRVEKLLLPIRDGLWLLQKI